MGKERTRLKNKGEVSRTRAAEKFALIPRVMFSVSAFVEIPVYFGFSVRIRCQIEPGIFLNA